MEKDYIKEEEFRCNKYIIIKELLTYIKVVKNLNIMCNYLNIDKITNSYTDNNKSLFYACEIKLKEILSLIGYGYPLEKNEYKKEFNFNLPSLPKIKELEEETDKERAIQYSSDIFMTRNYKKKKIENLNKIRTFVSIYNFLLDKFITIYIYLVYFKNLKLK